MIMLRRGVGGRSSPSSAAPGPCAGWWPSPARRRRHLSVSISSTAAIRLAQVTVARLKIPMPTKLQQPFGTGAYAAAVDGGHDRSPRPSRWRSRCASTARRPGWTASADFGSIRSWHRRSSASCLSAPKLGSLRSMATFSATHCAVDDAVRRGISTCPLRSFRTVAPRRRGDQLGPQGVDEQIAAKLARHQKAAQRRLVGVTGRASRILPTAR